MTEATTADVQKEMTTYPVRDFIDAGILKRDLAFSQNNLTDAMMQQASMFSHYGVLAADASRQVDVVKLLLENCEAAVSKNIRNELAEAGEKATEPTIAARIARHPRVVSMKKALNEAKRIEVIGKMAVESFRHRRDMLVQLGLISREEMKGELRIGEKSAREEAASAQKDLALARLSRKNNAETSE